MNRGFILAGATLVGIGVIMLIMLLMAGTDPVSPIGAPAPDLSARADPPSRLWSVLIGATIAGGAALIGIGMNRWRSTRQLRQP